ncbi:MAG: sulfane dehydrogenase subunit SoxC [Gammaproteobacteria bacterium]|jgi:sulfane dehydrogenase subunit SoxC
MTQAHRRRFLRRARDFAAAVGGALVAPHATAAIETTKYQGAPTREYGSRSRFETLKRVVIPARYPASTASWTPLGDLDGIITPSALHYERHHAGVPDLDPATHQLTIHGLVERPLVFSVADLRRFPAVHRICFLECSGNSYQGYRGPAGKDVQQTHGLTSCTDWGGVALKTVLNEVGIQADARWVVAEGADGAAMTRSIPLAKCLDDVILAYAQNGEALRPEQGYPVRLLVPGFEGSISVKWLRRLKLTASAYYTREETSKYTDLMADGRAREFTFVMEAKSVITSPSAGQQLSAPGFHEIRGLAWSGRGKIVRVDVSVDDGKSWREATIHGPVLPICHTRFSLDWEWHGSVSTLLSRCIDETGYTQPSRQHLVQQRGEHAFYHNNAMQRWRIDSAGLVHNE